MADDKSPVDDPELAAAQWVVRLGAGPLDAQDRRAFDAWLIAHPDHAAAFKQAQAAWRHMGELSRVPGSLGRHSVLADRARPANDAGRRRFASFAALAASIVCAIGVGSAWLGDPVTYWRADYHTRVAQMESVTLPDGSRAALGPSSAIAVHYGRDERRIELLSGVAYFTAVPRAQAGGRPFIVAASNGTARALGTRFQVDRARDSVDVTVMEHDVAVSAADRAGRVRHIILSPGQGVRYDRDGDLGETADVSAEQALAWRHGRLVFDREPLARVVEGLNRYRAGRIVIIGDRLARQRVSGVFEASDVDGALSALAVETGARRVSGPLFTVLY
ncbi:FecR domain-containing protein [Sphingomonadaceae bacterium jetA1]|uniref:FecR family protein n=1 Tax=Facivitalis istanbulensis TaxID=3075838 RepID=UPI003476D707